MTKKAHSESNGFWKKLTSKLPEKNRGFYISGILIVVAIIILAVIWGIFREPITEVVSKLEYNSRPEISYSSIQDGEENVLLNQTIKISFSKKVDASEVESQLESDNDIDFVVTQVEGTVVEIASKTGWKTDKIYNIWLNDDDFIKGSFHVQFRTITQPKLTLSNLTSTIPTQHEFLFAFDAEVFENYEEYEKNGFIQFDPELSGTTTILSPSVVRFVPAEPLPLGNLTIRVDAMEIQSEDDLYMEKDYVREVEVADMTDEEIQETIADDMVFYQSYTDVRPGTTDDMVFVVGDIFVKESFEEMFSLTMLDEGRQIPVTFEWQDVTYEDIHEELSSWYSYYLDFADHLSVIHVVPSEEWREGVTYQIKLSDAVETLNGEVLERSQERDFSTISKLKVYFPPLDYGKWNSLGYFYIDYSNDLLSTEDEIISAITLFDRTDNTTIPIDDYSHYGSEIDLYPEMVNGHEYTITVSAGIQDVYEDVLEEDQSFDFHVESSQEKSVWFYGESLAYAENTGDHRALFSSQGVTNVVLNVVKVNPSDVKSIQDNYNQNATAFGEVIQTYQETVSPEVQKLNEPVEHSYLLDNLEDGVYILEVVGDGTTRSRRILVLSSEAMILKNSNLGKGLIFAFHTDDGSPVVGKTLTVQNETTKETWEVQLNAQGIAEVDGLQRGDNYDVFSIFDSEGSLYVRSGYPFSNSLSASSYANTIGLWNKNMYFGYFDRMVYRPGEEVNFKIYAERRELSGLSPLDGTVDVVIENYDDTTIYSRPLELSRFGSANDTFTLPEDLQMGEYDLYVNDNYIKQIRVEEYKNYNFSFEASLDDAAVQGSQGVGIVELDANYYFGDPLKDADVEVTVYARDYGYHFSQDDNHYYFPQMWDLINEGLYGEYSSIEVGHATAKTDQSGHALIDVEYEIPEYIAYSVSKKLSFEVSVKDDMEEEEIHTLYVDVAPKSGLIGVNDGSWYIGGDEVYTANLVYLGEDFMPVSGEKIVAEIYSVNYSEVKRRRLDGVYFWDSYAQQELITTTEVTTDATGNAVLTYDPEISGSYEVIFKLKNDENVMNFSNFSYYEENNYYYYYEYNRNREMTLETDQETYNVGDTMSVIPGLPGDNYIAFVTVESDEILDYQVVDLGAGEKLSLDIEAIHQPNFYYSVMAFSPSDENGFLDLRMAVKRVTVGIEDKYLDTTIETDKDVYAPRDTVHLTVTTTQDGEGQEVEYLIGVIDKAALDIARINQNDDLQEDIISNFWSDWSDNVSTYSSLAVYENKIVADKAWGAKGGGGDGSLGLQREDVRSNFKDVAFWLPAEVSEDGTLTTSFEIPDNLTEWEIVALATTTDGRFGASTQHIVSKKQVNVISSLPEYLYSKDAMDVTYGVSFDRTVFGEDDDLFVAFAVQNGELLEECEDTYEDGCRYPLVKDQNFVFPITPIQPGAMVLTLAVMNGEEVLDAVEHTIEVRPNVGHQQIREINNTSVEPEYSYTFPYGHDIGEKTVTVRLNDDLVGDTSYLIDYYEQYTNACAEQTASKIHAFLLMNDSEGYAEKIQNSIDWLYHFQQSNGGLGIWEDSPVSYYTSVYVADAMTQAKNAGFDVDQNFFDNLIAYISRNIGNTNSVDEESYGYLVLAQNGLLDLDRVHQLVDSTVYPTYSFKSRANLLETYSIAENSDIGSSEKNLVKEKMQMIMKDLYDNLKISTGKAHFEEPVNFSNYYYVNDLATTSYILSVLLKVEGASDSLIPMVNWVKDKTAQMQYGGTYSRYYALRSLIEAKGVFSVNFDPDDFEVSINDEKHSSYEEKDGYYEVVTTLSSDTNAVSVSFDPGSDDMVYYEILLDYDLEFSNIIAHEQGMSIFSEYYDQDGTLHKGNMFQKGQIYIQKTTLVVHEELQQTEVHIPLPAGMSALNFNLNFLSEELKREFLESDYGSNMYSHMEIRDDEVVFFTDDMSTGENLQKGIYEFVFYVKPVFAGAYEMPSEWASEMYLPANHATQKSDTIVVE